MKAIIVPGAGTIVVREDGSIVITDRNRSSYILSAEIVDGISKLISRREQEEGDRC